MNTILAWGIDGHIGCGRSAVGRGVVVDGPTQVRSFLDRAVPFAFGHFMTADSRPHNTTSDPKIVLQNLDF